MLDNAAKYSQNNAKIKIELQKDNVYLTLRIKDQGIGIREENYDKIFDRFYQEDQAHSSQVKGTGIGLAIVKDIVTKYHGKISVSANTPKGTIFEIKLPL